MKRRIFIAVNLPQKIKEELTDLISTLQKNNQQSFIKWINPENLHITLHFLGYLNEEEIKKVNQIMEEKTQPIRCELRMINIDAFPNLSRPRVIFIAIEEIGDKRLSNLQKELGIYLEKEGFEIEKRPWQPHLTLARIKNSTPGNKFKFYPVPYSFHLLKFKIRSIDLMESKLERGGAKYKLLLKKDV